MMEHKAPNTQYSSPQTTAKEVAGQVNPASRRTSVKSASEEGKGQESEPWTVGDVKNTFSKATLGTPNEYMPEWMTGALPRTLLTSGVGGLAGYYLLPEIMDYIHPGYKRTPLAARARRMGAVLGGLGGLGINFPDLYSSFQSARGTNRDEEGNAVQRGHWSQGFKGLVNGWEGIRGASEAPVKTPVWSSWGKEKSGSLKEAGFWNEPTVDPYTLTSATRQALYEGRIDPVAALQSATAMDRAQKTRDGFMSPGSAGKAIADTVMQAGVGATGGFIAGKVGGALLGAFGMLKPETQRKAGPASALAGAVANVLTGSSVLE